MTSVCNGVWHSCLLWLLKCRKGRHITGSCAWHPSLPRLYSTRRPIFCITLVELFVQNFIGILNHVCDHDYCLGLNMNLNTPGFISGLYSFWMLLPLGPTCFDAKRPTISRWCVCSHCILYSCSWGSSSSVVFSQWYSDKCLTTGSLRGIKTLIFSICQFSWCK